MILMLYKKQIIKKFKLLYFQLKMSMEKEEDQTFESKFDPFEFIPVSLTDLIVEDWSNMKYQDTQRKIEVFRRMNGVGVAKFRSGNVYEGHMKQGLMMDDHGKFTWVDNTVFTGSFYKNEITGRGTYNWPNGTSYTGEVLKGIRHGEGSYINIARGYSYEGSWKEGLRDGKGILKYFDPKNQEKVSAVYEGHWKKGKKNGFGKYLYPSGNVYEGEWKNNLRNGQGTMKWYTYKEKEINEKYTGEWKDDQQFGFGTHIWLDEMGESRVLRNRYVGYWKYGVREGQGIFFYSNGSLYIGEWKKNQKHGKGHFIYENGDEYEGKFERDRMVDRALQGEVKTTINAAGLDPTRTLGKDFDKTKRSLGKTDRLSTDRCQTRYYVTERVRHELEGNIYDTMIDISDIAFLFALEHAHELSYAVDIALKDQSIQDEVNKVLLAHHSQLKRWYRIYSREVDFPNLEEGFMMVSSQFWRMLQDCKILAPWFTLAQYNRIFEQGKKTHFSLKYEFYLGPIDPITKNNGESESESFSKEESKVIAVSAENSLTNIVGSDNEEPEKIFPQNDLSDEEELPLNSVQSFDSRNIHDPHTPMLFRHFAEAVVRAAYLYYINESSSLNDKLSKLFSEKLEPGMKSILNDEEDNPIPQSLSYLYEDWLKPFDDSLLSIFKLYSNQSLHLMQKTIDYLAIMINLFG